MQGFIQENILKREASYIRKLKLNGDIEDVAVYVSKMNLLDTLIDYT